MDRTAQALGGDGSARLLRLDLANFRNWPSLRLDMPETGEVCPVMLIGPNGAGKTNLLEALSFLSPGRGLRGAALSDATRIGSSAPWAVHARLEISGERVEIGTGLRNDPASHGRRAVHIDGTPAGGQSALGERLSVLWLTPQMDRLFCEPASARRRFLDRIVLAREPGHAAKLSSYERAMRERNRLLARRGGAADPAWLSALEAQMARDGIALTSARRLTLTQLAARLDQAPDGPFPRAGIALDGPFEDLIAGLDDASAEEAFRRRLAADRGRDAALGRTNEGPHRSDLAVWHRTKDMPAAACSTGEQKALLIGIVLAHAGLVCEETGRAPLLLLDEIAAHLDAARRDALLAQLLDHPGQAFLTGTEETAFSALRSRGIYYDIEAGRIARTRHLFDFKKRA
ncbi:MAG: DNA replication/repair protein RecF [Rhodothalassiaceae bacterium]